MRIEISKEIADVIHHCANTKVLDDDETMKFCDKFCPLGGACLEYWTGDDSLNKEE
jgi:hypothetical protein